MGEWVRAIARWDANCAVETRHVACTRQARGRLMEVFTYGCGRHTSLGAGVAIGLRGGACG